jgi:hypothetical protein
MKAVVRKETHKEQPSIPETFSEYIALLPPWEQSLFEGLDMPLDCYALINAATAIKPNDYDFKLHLLSLSDGSAVNQSMSFGWVMSLPTAQRAMDYSQSPVSYTISFVSVASTPSSRFSSVAITIRYSAE